MRSFVVVCILARGDGDRRVRPGVDQGRGPQAGSAGHRSPRILQARSTGRAYRIQDEQGRAVRRHLAAEGDSELREARPDPKGAIQFPFLADGELLGVLQFATEGHDYRDQPIAKGVYTMRYGLQPVNGDHLGVSTYRDYVLLLPAGEGQVAAPPRPQATGGAERRVGRDEPSRRLLAADGTAGGASRIRR